jgi:hypothetical protein
LTAVAVDAPLDLRATWRRWRAPVGVAAFLLLAAVILAVVGNAPPSLPLDPSDTSPDGGRALAELVRDRGVDVVPVKQVSVTSLTPGSTVFVPDPTSLTRGDLHLLAGQARMLVVIAPTERELTALGVVATLLPHGGEVGTLHASCGFTPASVAGDVHYEGPTYVAPAAEQQCYSSGVASGLFVYSTGHSRVVVLGSPRTLSNDWLDDQGDAALGLGLLSTADRLVWLVPRPATQAPADNQPKGLVELLPARVLWGALQLLVAVVVLALWRARRVGPVVAEPLPVVVRATETVEGRARLLRVARARATAAAALRAAAVERLRNRLRLSADSTSAAVVDSVSRHSGWRSADVERVLFGPPPADDAGLLVLSKELDQLDRAVRSGS